MALDRDPAKAREWQRRSAQKAEENRRAKAKSGTSRKPSSVVAKPVPPQVTAPRPRKSNLAPRSPKPHRVAHQKAVAAACGAAIARDRGQCQAAGLAPGACWGRMDPQHVIPQGVDRSLAAEVDNIIACCRGHHEWLGDHPEEARELGIHGRYGDDLAELAARRVALRH